MDLRDLLSGQTTTTVVPVGDEEVKVTFRRNAMTPELEAQAQSADGGQGLPPLIAALVVDWDLTDDGEPYAVTIENVRRLPYSFLVALTKEITKEVASDPLSAGTSDAPS